MHFLYNYKETKTKSETENDAYFISKEFDIIFSYTLNHSINRLTQRLSFVLQEQGESNENQLINPAFNYVIFLLMKGAKLCTEQFIDEDKFLGSGIELSSDN